MINNLVRKSIEVDKKNITPLWEIKQEDECIIKLSLYRQSKAFDITGQALRLGIKRKDKTLVEVSDSDSFIINGNELDIKLKNSISAIAGPLECDLELSDSTGKMTTASFFINVKDKVLNGQAVEGTNEFDTFSKTVAKVEEDYNSLRKIIIDENQAANLQDQVNKTNSQLENIASDMLPDVMKKISNKEAIKIVGFGDSTMFGTGLSEGEKNVLDWLKQKISYIYNNNNLTFINSGMPGNSTDNMLSQIKGKVLDYSPNMCIFWSGLNDVNSLTIEQYKSNVRSIIIELKNNNIVPLICSPIPSMKKDDDYNFKVGKYAQAIKEVCIEKNVNFIDIYEEFSKLILNEVITYKDYLDTVHVTTRGCKYMSDIILKELLYDYKCKLKIDELLPIESPFVKCDVGWRYIANDISSVNNICYVLDGSNNSSVKFALWVNNNESFLEMQSYLENNLAQIQVKDFGDDYKILDFKTDKTMDFCGYVNMELTSGLHFFEFSNSNILKGKLGLYSFKLCKNEKENPLLHFSRVDLVPENEWQLLPSNYEKFEVIKDGYKVTIQGLISGGLEVDNTVVTTLPEGYRPKATIFRDSYCLDSNGVQQSILFELRASGEVLYVKFKGKNWLSFNGISFYI